MKIAAIPSERSFIPRFFSDRRFVKGTCILSTIAILTRIGLYFAITHLQVVQGHPFKFDADTVYYLKTAHQIAAQWHGAHGAPVVLANTYPFVLAAVVFLGLPLVTAIFLNGVVAAGAAVITAYLLWSLAGVKDWRILLAGECAIALFPSLVLWGSVPLKDTSVVGCMAMLLVGTVIWVRRGGYVWLVATIAAAFLLVGLRTYIVFPLGAALLATVIFVERRRDVVIRVLVCLFLVGTTFVPQGFGLWGWRYAAQFASVTKVATVQRTVFGVGASTLGPEAKGHEPPKSTASAQSRATVVTGRQTIALRAGADLAYLVAGPYVWNAGSGGITHDLAYLDLLVWYPLMLLTVYGVVRRRCSLAIILITVGVLMIALAAVVDNAGALVRYRSELVPGMTMLAMTGLWQWSRRTSRGQRGPVRDLP